MTKALAAAERQEEFYAENAGVDIVTDGVTWHPVNIPAYKKCRRLVLQCQKEAPTFDMDVDTAPFRVASKSTGPGIQFASAGVSLPLAFGPEETEKTLCYVQAPTGYKILVCLVA